MKILITSIILLIQCICQSTYAQSEVEDSMYKKAILDGSTAPYFVLVCVVNDLTGSSDTVCTEAPFLLGALHIEYHIAYSDSGEILCEKLAISNTKRVFHFKNCDALNNISMRYDNSILAIVRKELSKLSKAELSEQLRKADSKLHRLYQSQSGNLFYSYRDAIAQILLENKIQVRRGCIASNLFSD
jgi:hypothetical protein